MLVMTTHGELDEAFLQKTGGVVDNENETTTWVEYCLKDCDGIAHRTGHSAAAGLFCAQHVHRSVHVALKQGVEGLGVAANFST